MSQTYPDILANHLLSESRIKITDRDDACATWFLGAAEPASMAAGRPWIDTNAVPNLIKVRNVTNTGWHTIGTYATNMGHVLLSGTTMTGNINMGTNKITNSAAPGADTDGEIKSNVDAKKFINKGKAWISHGDNVITFGTAHDDNKYKFIVQLVKDDMGGVTSRLNPHTQPASLIVSNESTTRGKVRINGGYGFTTGGFIAARIGITERFDDVANTHTARLAITSRESLTGYSLNGFGFSSCGYDVAPIEVGTTQRFDDIINTHTARLAATIRFALAGYSLNGYGFTSCGYQTTLPGDVGTTQRFDDVANTHTARQLATDRMYLAGYSLNGYGFTTCGWTGANSGITERFDDDANTQTARTAATSRERIVGYSLNGFGFSSCGSIGGIVGTTERFDDEANTHTARLAATARARSAGYSLNGFGFTSCGRIVANTGVTERFDDVANTHTGRTNATARRGTAGYATNEYFINYITFN